MITTSEQLKITSLMAASTAGGGAAPARTAAAGAGRRAGPVVLAAPRVVPLGHQGRAGRGNKAGLAVETWRTSGRARCRAGAYRRVHVSGLSQRSRGTRPVDAFGGRGGGDEPPPRAHAP